MVVGSLIAGSAIKLIVSARLPLSVIQAMLAIFKIVNEQELPSISVNDTFVSKQEKVIAEAAKAIEVGFEILKAKSYSDCKNAIASFIAHATEHTFVCDFFEKCTTLALKERFSIEYHDNPRVHLKYLVFTLLPTLVSLAKQKLEWLSNIYGFSKDNTTWPVITLVSNAHCNDIAIFSYATMKNEEDVRNFSKLSNELYSVSLNNYIDFMASASNQPISIAPHFSLPREQFRMFSCKTISFNSKVKVERVQVSKPIIFEDQMTFSDFVIKSFKDLKQCNDERFVLMSLNNVC